MCPEYSFPEAQSCSCSGFCWALRCDKKHRADSLLSFMPFLGTGPSQMPAKPLRGRVTVKAIQYGVSVRSQLNSGKAGSFTHL